MPYSAYINSLSAMEPLTKCYVHADADTAISLAREAFLDEVAIGGKFGTKADCQEAYNADMEEGNLEEVCMEVVLPEIWILQLQWQDSDDWENVVITGASEDEVKSHLVASLNQDIADTNEQDGTDLPPMESFEQAATEWGFKWTTWQVTSHNPM